MRRITPQEADTLRFICRLDLSTGHVEPAKARLDEALEPVYFDDDGWRVYFDAANYN